MLLRVRYAETMSLEGHLSKFKYMRPFPAKMCLFFISYLHQACSVLLLDQDCTLMVASTAKLNDRGLFSLFL